MSVAMPDAPVAAAVSLTAREFVDEHL